MHETRNPITVQAVTVSLSTLLLSPYTPVLELWHDLWYQELRFGVRLAAIDIRTGESSHIVHCGHFR